MKHYYESEILNQLMERDGLKNPSSTPVYESEIREQLLNQVTPSYPKLNDYESEWLMYNHTKHLPADFPVESATNVSQATFNNVVPYAYGKAVLKGQTLVNLAKVRSKQAANAVGELNIPIKPNAKYIAFSDVTYDNASNLAMFVTSSVYVEDDPSLNGDSIYSLAVQGDKGKENMWNQTGAKYVTFTSDSNHCYLHIRTGGGSSNLKYNNMQVFEYQEGMENWDIPYFEGMQSVKMPVLKTTGKNLFNSNNLVIEPKNLYGYFDFTDYDGTLTFSIRDKDTSIDMSEIFLGVTYQGYIYDGTTENNGGWLLCNGSLDLPSLATSMCKYLSFYPKNQETLDKLMSRYNIQVEIGSTVTPYEPFQSNILTVNEEVELRGVGDAHDELDCLTGEVTERIGEIVLDGSEKWLFNASYLYAELPLNDYSGLADNICINNRLPQILIYGNESSLNDNRHGLMISKSKLIRIRMADAQSGQTIDGIKQYLSQNPLTVQYPLATESIKTVDLTCKDQNGETTLFMPIEGTTHLETSGQPIKPQMEVEIPVEAITQNLASFIDIEGEDNE